jgi:hypothetical protein
MAPRLLSRSDDSQTESTGVMMTERQVETVSERIARLQAAEETVSERVARLQGALEDLQRRTGESTLECQELIDSLRRTRAPQSAAPKSAAESE